MGAELQFYLDGAWVDPATPQIFDVIDPSTEDSFAQISLGTKADVDSAVAAAKRASRHSGLRYPAERRDLLRRVVEVYKTRRKDLAAAVSRGMARRYPSPRRPGRDRPRASEEDGRGAGHGGYKPSGTVANMPSTVWETFSRARASWATKRADTLAPSV